MRSKYEVYGWIFYWESWALGETASPHGTGVTCLPTSNQPIKKDVKDVTDPKTALRLGIGRWNPGRIRLREFENHTIKIKIFDSYTLKNI